MQETQETQVPTLCWEESWKKETATCSSILTWKIPWTKKLGGLQGLQSQTGLSTLASLFSSIKDQTYDRAHFIYI